MDENELSRKRDRLLDILRGYGRVAVAFSGGVDSALVAKAAALACGENAVAVTARSASLATGELQIAESVAREIGITHRVIETQEFSVAGYQQNAGNRCYFCKSELYHQLESIRAEHGFDVICNGANLDDRGDHRPGMIAAAENHVRSPLIDAEFTKQDVRNLAFLWKLPVWNKPASPCLSSRIAYGVEVTRERVVRVDQAEHFLKQRLECDELRVRLEHHDLARIELPISSLSRLTEESLRSDVIEKFLTLGFKYVTLDLQGLRSGSMNHVLQSSALSILDSD